MGVLSGQVETRSDGSWSGVPPLPPFPGTDMFGQRSVSSDPSSAITLPTIWACVNLVADTVSTLPLQTFRKGGDVSVRITDPPLILNPTADKTQSEWLHELMVSLLVWGNAYCQIVSRDQMGRPTQLQILDPGLVRVVIDTSTGLVRYLVGQGSLDMTGSIWHIRNITLPGKRVGLSPVIAAATTIGVDISARKFASDFYNGGGVPKATLQSDLVIDQQQADDAKKAVAAATMNREPLVLGEGLKYDLNSVKAEESQFLATQAFNIGQIARYFKIPAEMVGGSSGSSLTYTTVELNSLQFLTFGLGFWLRRIEDAFFQILPQPQKVQFDVSQLLRTDAESSAKVDAIDIAAKIIAPSEKRTKRNLPPLTQDQKDELELVPLTINIGTGLPKSLPNPPTPETSDDTPVVGKPPAVPKVGANG